MSVTCASVFEAHKITSIFKRVLIRNITYTRNVEECSGVVKNNISSSLTKGGRQDVSACKETFFLNNNVVKKF
jgi:hypothetical protein